KEQQEISRQNEQAEKNQFEAELTVDPTPSLADLTDVEPTRPEELDEVFRKKDRNIQKEEEQPAATVSFNENTKKTASTKAEERKRLESKTEQETTSKPLNNDTNETIEETHDKEDTQNVEAYREVDSVVMEKK